MSTSFLYHTFGIRGYRYVRTEYKGGGAFYTIRQERERTFCSSRGGDEFIYPGHTERRFRAPPIGGKPVTTWSIA